MDDAQWYGRYEEFHGVGGAHSVQHRVLPFFSRVGRLLGLRNPPIVSRSRSQDFDGRLHRIGEFENTAVCTFYR